MSHLFPRTQSERTKHIEPYWQIKVGLNLVGNREGLLEMKVERKLGDTVGVFVC